MSKNPISSSTWGDRRIRSILADLEPKFEELLAAPRARRTEHPPIPRVPGIYLFSERGKPIYVGRSRNLRQRLSYHSSGDRYTATFAFRIALRAAEKKKIDTRRRRAEIEVDPDFQPLFERAKKRVARMDVQFVEIADPVSRALFEIYAAVRLGTDEVHNSFEEH